jgi:hypothetical protein
MEQPVLPVSAKVAETLRLCVREPSATTPEGVSRALTTTVDWSSTVRVAAEHRVLGYIGRAAAESGVRLPAAVQETIRGNALIQTGDGLRMETQLRRLAAAFARVEVPVIVLKGPALARTLYPTINLRPYADLDLTVRDLDEDAAVGVLLDNGFHEMVDPFERARRPHRAHDGHEGHYHRRFENPDGSVLVELHLDPLQLGLKTVCEAGRWQRAVSLPGVPGALMLGPEDQVVQLSVHAHKHGFERLIWLKDLDLLVRQLGDTLDWSLVAEVARSEGVCGSVWYALRLTQKLLGTPLPADVQALRPAMPVRMLYRLVWPLGSVAGLHAKMRRRAVQFRAAESLRGMLPATLLMGRRRARTRAFLDVAFGRASTS